MYIFRFYFDNLRFEFIMDDIHRQTVYNTRESIIEIQPIVVKIRDGYVRENFEK